MRKTVLPRGVATKSILVGPFMSTKGAKPCKGCPDGMLLWENFEILHLECFSFFLSFGGQIELPDPEYFTAYSDITKEKHCIFDKLL